MNGTKNRISSDNKKIAGEILISLSSLIDDKMKIISIPKKTKNKCFKKKA